MSRHILSVRIDSLTPSEALNKVAAFLSSGEKHTIFTPNPEMLAKATEDSYFKEVLNRGDLNICDGFGISLVSGFRIKRITGVDCMLDICRLAEEKGRSVYLLGSASQTVVQKAAARLQHQFPQLQIVGADPGPVISELKTGELQIVGNEEIIENINSAEPTILFVAFGMGKQEKWIAEHLQELPSVKLAMGVGGSFDYLSGAASRAPRLMRVLGLEWLYRLVRQPERFGRIWNATVKFLFLCIFSKS